MLKNVVFMVLSAAGIFWAGCICERISSSKERVVPEAWEGTMMDSAMVEHILLGGGELDQAQLTVRSALEAEVADAHLLRTYVRLWESMSGYDRQRLYAEQARWLERRPALVYQRSEYTEGSISAMSYNMAATVVIKERREALLRYYRSIASR